MLPPVTSGGNSCCCLHGIVVMISESVNVITQPGTLKRSRVVREWQWRNWGGWAQASQTCSMKAKPSTEVGKVYQWAAKMSQKMSKASAGIRKVPQAHTPSHKQEDEVRQLFQSFMVMCPTGSLYIYIIIYTY